MHSLKIILSMIIALVLGCGDGPPASPFFFIQMADPQLGMYTDNEDFTRETELFTSAIEHANRLKPAFIVICGDLLNRPGDEAQRDEFLRICSLLDKTISIYLAPGNHDVKDEPTPESIDWYRERISHERYGFRYRGTYGITINSSLVHSPASAMDAYQDQLRFLRKELRRADAGRYRHIFVFTHHPFFLETPDEDDQYYNIPLERRTEHLELFAQYGVEAIFAGHYHRNSYGEANGMKMITTGPIGKPLGDDPSGFRIVKVYPDSMRHAYYALNEVPDEVILDEE